MPIIEIDINEYLSQYRLTGAVGMLLNNRRAKFFLKDHLDADTSNSGAIVIPYAHDTKEEVYNNIEELLQRLDFSAERSPNLVQVLGTLLREKQDFISFSKKARDIRENQYDEQELHQFQSVIRLHLKRRLYPLQLLSAYHLAYAVNACNFSVPGAGKTSMVYAAYAYMKNSLNNEDESFVERLLVIGPLSSFGPWESEYESCFGKKVESKRLAGLTPDERTDYFYSDHSAELTLMSYQSVASSLKDIIYFLKRHRVMVVLDEAHRIKNTSGGIWAESVLSLAKYCRSRVVLTGTPVPNGYEDLYNLYKFIWPSKDIIGFHLYQLKDMSSKENDPRVDELTSNIAPFFIRIPKRHLGLPKVLEHEPEYVPMGAVQKDVYTFIEAACLEYFQKNQTLVDVKNSLVRARLIRLMQAATNPALLKGPIDDFIKEFGSDESDLPVETYRQPTSEVVNYSFVDDARVFNHIINYQSQEIPSKFESVLRLTEQIIRRNEKVIIWTTFVQNIFSLQAFFKKYRINAEMLYGGIPVEGNQKLLHIRSREDIIRDFHLKSSPFKVIIANPFSVGESISIHKACNNAIYLERTFNAAHFIQSKDRIHRVGSDVSIPVNYYYILSKDSVDETIHARLEVKTKRMLEIIEKKPIPLFEENLNYESDYKDDIKALISDYVDRAATP